MIIRQIFRTKTHGVLATLALFFILNASIKSIYFSSEKEIIYNHSTSVFLCLKDDINCTYISEFKLANTGSVHLENILVNFSELPKTLSFAIKVMDLNASKPRNSNPKIVKTYINNINSIKINNLSPGTLVVVKISGNIPKLNKTLLTNLNIDVISSAKVINANPQGTEFVRMWTMFF